MGFFKKLKNKLTSLNVEEKKVVIKNKNIATDKKLLKQKKKLDKYINGLQKSGFSFSEKIKDIFSKNVKINDELFEELEDLLIMSDISTELVMKIIGKIKLEVKSKKVTDSKKILDIVVKYLHASYGEDKESSKLDIKDGRINVIIMVGVNGVGKTTSIAKMANKYKSEGKTVIIAAADTFRAGAVEQLTVWAERVGVDIIKPIKHGVDPSSVVFDAVKKAKEEVCDVLIIDTAGRLQNKVNLMNELSKMKKIIEREIKGAPHETLLVIDSTTGQNGVSQAKKFNEILDITGIILTKLDGTSKGGIVLTIRNELKLSVKLIGLGEGLDDLQSFDIDSFIYGMTKGIFDDN